MTKLTGSLGVRNEINVDIIGTGARGKEGKSVYEIWLTFRQRRHRTRIFSKFKGQDGYTPIKGIVIYWRHRSAQRWRWHWLLYVFRGPAISL